MANMHLSELLDINSIRVIQDGFTKMTGMAAVLSDENGVPVKEWFAIASYLKQMGGTMDSKYAAPDGRKLVYSSWSPISLYSNPNAFTCVLLGAEVAAALLLAVLLRCIYRKQKLKKIQKEK